MAILAIRMASATNGVSLLHGEVSRKMWHSLWPDGEEQDVPIGVHAGPSHGRGRQGRLRSEHQRADVQRREARRCDAIDDGLDGSLTRGLDLEFDAFVEVFGTEDARTGVASFLENGPGKATFSGR